MRTFIDLLSNCFLTAFNTCVLTTPIHTASSFKHNIKSQAFPTQHSLKIPVNEMNNYQSASLENITIDPLDSEEAISDLTFMLSLVDSPQMLAILTSTEGFTRQRLNLAASRLPLSQRQKIREWAMENRRSTA